MSELLLKVQVLRELYVIQNRPVSTAMKIIRELPTINLVRCGECKHSKEWYADRCLCYLWAEEGVSVFEDGYCSYGEREGK